MILLEMQSCCKARKIIVQTERQKVKVQPCNVMLTPLLRRRMASTTWSFREPLLWIVGLLFHFGQTSWNMCEYPHFTPSHVTCRLSVCVPIHTAGLTETGSFKKRAHCFSCCTKIDPWQHRRRIQMLNIYHVSHHI